MLMNLVMLPVNMFQPYAITAIPAPNLEHQPYLMTDNERTALLNYTADFNPAPYQPPKVSFDPALPGTFHDYNPNPLSDFHTWVAHCIHTNPADFVDLTDEEKSARAQWAWMRVLTNKDVERMRSEYDERVEDWYARRAEWEIAAGRELDRPGAGMEGRRRGEELKVEADEDVGGGQGGFTAVNG